MKRLLSFFLPVAIFAVVTVSMVSLNSCRDIFTGPDTVYVPPPTKIDSDWVSRNSGTTQGLGNMQFLTDNVGYVTGGGGVVLMTSDGGASWKSLTPTPLNNLNYTGANSNYGVWFFDQQNAVVVGDGRDVYHTSNGGASWFATSISTSEVLRSLTFVDRSVGFLGTADALASPPGITGELWRTDDGGMTWTKAIPVTNGGIYCIQFVDRQHGVAVGKFGAAYWTNDGGQTWQVGSSDVNDQFRSVSFVSSTTAYALALNGNTNVSGEILRTTDAGQTWRTIRSLNYGGNALATNGQSVITAVGYGGNVTESTDGGATWKDYQVGQNRWIDVAYSSATHAIMVGELGLIDTRTHRF